MLEVMSKIWPSSAGLLGLWRLVRDAEVAFVMAIVNWRVHSHHPPHGLPLLSILTWSVKALPLAAITYWSEKALILFVQGFHG